MSGGWRRALSVSVCLRAMSHACLVCAAPDTFRSEDAPTAAAAAAASAAAGPATLRLGARTRCGSSAFPKRRLVVDGRSSRAGRCLIVARGVRVIEVSRWQQETSSSLHSHQWIGARAVDSMFIPFAPCSWRCLHGGCRSTSLVGPANGWVAVPARRLHRTSRQRTVDAVVGGSCCRARPRSS